jgi:sugar/nucleoside kinase (ribokinase family)
VDEIFSYARHKGDTSRLTAIIVTLGSEGIIYAEPGIEEFTHYEALKIEKEDIKSVLGSGDNFMAGFIYGLFQNKPSRECIEMG